jgi:hypothetical protein
MFAGFFSKPDVLSTPFKTVFFAIRRHGQRYPGTAPTHELAMAGCMRKIFSGAVESKVRRQSLANLLRIKADMFGIKFREIFYFRFPDTTLHIIWGGNAALARCDQVLAE